MLCLPFAAVRPATPLPVAFAISSELELAGFGGGGIGTKAGGELIFDFLLHLNKLVNECGLQQNAAHDLDLGAMAAFPSYQAQKEVDDVPRIYKIQVYPSRSITASPSFRSLKENWIWPDHARTDTANPSMLQEATTSHAWLAGARMRAATTQGRRPF